MENTNNTKNGDQLVLPPIKKKAPYVYVVFIAAFLGAVLLWFYAIGYDSTIFERKIANVPVTVTGVKELNESKKFTAAGELTLEITVTVSGRRSDIYKLSSEDLKAIVDISGAQNAGENNFPITVTAPNGINITALSSDSVTLYLDEFITKIVAVNVVIGNYTLTDGLKLGETTVNPVVVTIEGPKQELDNIDSAFVDVPVGEVKGSISAYGSLYLKNKNNEKVENKYISMSQNDANIEIEVLKEKSVPIRVGFTGGVFTAESAVISLSEKSLTISGKKDLIDGINELVINIDETGYDLRNTNKIQVFTNTLLPEGVDNESGVVSVTVEMKVPDITKKFFYIPSANISGNAAVKAVDGITVSVIGYRDVLSGMTRDDILASINPDNIYTNEAGKEIAPVGFTFADGISGVYVLGTYTTEVHYTN